jgi:arylsulfatase A-like enzyme
MGYGDLNCQNPESKIPTPNLDKLASQGMRFSNAHSSSGISSPSRFGLLTGMYHWRRQHNIVEAFGKPFLKESDITLPEILKTKSYNTACFGKWHLGWDWEFVNEPKAVSKLFGKNVKYYQSNDINWNNPIKGGPLSHGFDYFFGNEAINMPPYTWIENDKVLEIPTEDMLPHTIGFKTKEGEWEFRPGPKVKGWNPYEVLPTISKKAVEWINSRKEGEPFFLYLALPSPHAPIIPNDEFEGKSKVGAYGDFVNQTDCVAGQVIKALNDKGFDENTIVIFSSDNGTERQAWTRAEKYGHFSMGNDRGLKQDVYEGGHHVPFILKWAGVTKPGSVTNELISQIDLMATFASIIGIEMPENAAPDSYDLTLLLKGKKYKSSLREATIHNTYENNWGIRKGDWLYINSPTGSTREMPESFKKLRNYTNFTTPGLLFNMKNDPEQRINLYNKYPKKVNQMKLLLKEYRESKRTVKL